jgi:hypothetical protein
MPSQVITEAKRARIRALFKMRGSKGSHAIVRAIILIIYLDALLLPGKLEDWLERPNGELDGASPIDLIKRGQWQMLAEWIDVLLTGLPM